MAEQSHYEINVSRLENRGVGHAEGYMHFFATAPRSVVTQQDLQRVPPPLLAAFPEPLYKVEVTRWETLGMRDEWRPAPGPKTSPETPLRRTYAGRRGGRYTG